MKRYFSAIVLALSACIVAGALGSRYLRLHRRGAHSHAASTPLGSVVEVDPVRRFGEVGAGVVLEHTFSVHNKSRATVFVTVGSTSCSCTSALSDRSVLAPGQDAHVRMRMETKGKKGQVSATASAMFRCDLGDGEAASGEIPLTLAASVDPSRGLLPAPLDFGEVQRGRPAVERAIRLVIPRSEAPAKLKDKPTVRLTGATVQMDPVGKDVHDGRVFEGLLKLDADAVDRGLKDCLGIIDVEVVSNDKITTYQMEFLAIIADKIRSRPSTIYLGRKEVGKEVTVELESGDGKPIHFVGIQDGQGAEWSWNLKDNDTKAPKLGLRIRPGSIANGLVRGSVRIKVLLGGASTEEVVDVPFIVL